MSGQRATEIDLHVSRRIKAARRAAGLTQEQVADKIGYTFQQVQKYETGRNRISAGKLAVLADLFGVPVGYFFEGAPGLAATAEMNGAASASDLVASLLTLPYGAELARDYIAIEHNSDRDVVARVARALRRVA